MEPIDFLRKRFGFALNWLNDLELKKEQETIFVGTPEVMQFDEIKALRRGLRLCRLFPHSIKPTTFAMQLLGKTATRNRIDVTEEQSRALINGGEIEIEADVENGFVIIFWHNFVVGVGLYKKPILKSHIPKFRPVD
ncbi:MAG: methyltransferase RsmF C-terminal domain-like protein [bacterium]